MDPENLRIPASWPGHLRGRILKALGRIRETQVPPSPAEAKEGARVLREMLRPAAFGALGGVRSDPENRRSSWFGGCALGAPGAEVPVGRSAKPMQPLLQLRVDQVEMPVPGLGRDALLVLWIDLEGDLFNAEEGRDFAVTSFASLDGLVPLGPGYRETESLPTFPVVWQSPVLQQPSWEDISFSLPQRVAWSDKSVWFFENPVAVQTSELQSQFPIKLGGWPTWIQGSQWEGTRAQEDFVLQIDSSAKGGIGFGDGGTIYLFRNRDSGAWLLRCDFF